MVTKIMEKVWELYPKSHIHCDVTLSGRNCYRIVTSLLTETDETVATVEEYGSGNLSKLKTHALEHLVEKLLNTHH